VVVVPKNSVIEQPVVVCVDIKQEREYDVDDTPRNAVTQQHTMIIILLIIFIE
jgi:hypothetical protein